MIEIEIKNLDKIQKAFDRYPKVSKNNFNNAIKRSLEKIRNEAKRNAPVDTGELRNKWSLTVGTLQGRLAPTAKHAVYIHNGTRPHFPPLKAIEPWARRHGVPAFAVALSISKKGTKANPFFHTAVKSEESYVNKQFTKALDLTLKKIWD